MHLTMEQVAEMAPDANSAAAGKKLMTPRHWQAVGQNEDALWGLCQGSAVYQVKVDWSNLGYHCSCPSRKFPCKHVLGLLMLCAGSPEAAPRAAPPEWAEQWLARRRVREQKKAEPRAEEDKPVDEKGRQRRAQQRQDRVGQGLERLTVWLGDLVRNGLAGLESQSSSFWEEPAKRLVDAQAAGLAARVSNLATFVGGSRDWPARLLAELGRIKLLVHAYERIDQLPPGLAQDVRQMIGWNTSQAELEEAGESVSDTWVVIGQYVDEQQRLRTQRTWIVGRDTARTALVLQFSAGGQPFAESIVPGCQQEGTLLFYPGAVRLRAKFVQREATARAIDRRLPATATIDEFLDVFSEQVARQPWSTMLGHVLHDVTITLHNDAWYVRDQSGRALPLAGREHWRILALSGGHPVDLAGEWDGYRWRPLALFVDGTYRVA